VPALIFNAASVYETEAKKVNEWWPSIAKYMDGVYLNYQMESLTADEYPSQYWGDNLERLVQIKNRYDPGNAFKFPQSLPLVVRPDPSSS
jgi:FAD/FMN-containing dehydrogenase